MKTPKKITIHFRRDEDYRLIPVNGVWGGVTPRGDIKAEFLHESQALPEAITHEVTAEGTLTKAKHTLASSYQRTVLVGMVLTAEQAESIGRWLQQRAREASEWRDARAPRAKGDDNEPRHSDNPLNRRLIRLTRGPSSSPQRITPASGYSAV